jgi:hypothetical protein
MSSLFKTGIIVSKGNSTTIPLAANATFAGSIDDVTSYEEIDINLFGSPSNAPGSLFFEFSPDGTNWDVSIQISGAQLPGPIIVPQLLRVVLPFFRVRYINGATLQTSFRLTVCYHRTSGTRLTRFLNQSVDNTEPIQVDKAIIMGQRTSDSTYQFLAINSSNALTIDGSSVTQPISTTQLPSSLIGNRVDTNIGSWLGSTVPTVGQKTSVNSIPVVLASDQTLSLTADIGKVDQGNQGTIGNSWFVEVTDGTNVLGTSSHPIRIDPVGTTTQPVSLTGNVTVVQSTAANLNATVTGTVIANIGTTNGLLLDATFTGRINTLGQKTMANSTPIVIASDQTAIPVSQSGSWTVTSNIGTTGGLALDATLAKLTIAQSTALGSNTQALIGGSVTASAPSYTTGNINPLSLTTSGGLRVDASGTIQPVSGTVTANQGTSPWVTNVTQFGSNNVVTGTGGSGVGIPRVTIANDSNILATQSGSWTVTANQGTNPWTTDITDRAGRLLGVVYGSQGQQIKQTATNFNTQVEIAVGAALIDPRAIRALTSADTVTVVQPSAANLLATVTQGTSPWVNNITQFGGVNISTGTGGSGTGIPRVTVANDSNVLATQSGTWTVQPGNTANTTPWLTTINQGGNSAIVTATNALKVDGSAVTQPVSGTVTANQGTNPWTSDVTDRAGRLLGVVYGSQGQQLKQTATNFNTQVEIAVGGTLIDPRAIRTLTSSDTVTVVQPTAANLLATVTQGTSPWVSNITQFGGSNISTGTGASGVGIPRVTVSNDSNILATQSGSWTVTSNIGTTNGLALDTTVSKLTIAQNATLGSNTQILIGGSTTTSAPTYITGTINPLSITTAGSLRVDNSGVTQPISGTITANIGTTNGLALDSSINGLLLSQGSVTLNQKGALIQGAVTTTAPSYVTAQTSPLSLTTAGALRIDGSGVTQPISGTITANAGSGTFSVSGTVTANIGTSGSLALDTSVTGLQIAQSSVTLGQKGGLIFGAVTTTAPTYTTAQSSPLSLTTTGNLRVDGSSVTQPISGTVTANAGSGTFTVSGTVTSNIGTTNGLALDTSVNGVIVAQGSATSGEKGPLIQGAVTTAAPSYTTGQTSPLNLTTAGALRTDASATTQPVSGTVTANQGGTWTVQPGNTANTTPWLTTINQGGNSVAVKAGSTAAVATDPALVVAISPNSGLIGSNANQVQGTAAAAASPVGNPVFIGGTDGSLVRGILTDTSGRIIVAPTGSNTTNGFAYGTVSTNAITTVPIRASTYNEQTTNAQRSISSSSANDTSAGTGARTVTITYYDATGAGPNTETITLNGTTSVNTTNNNICFIEKIMVATVGAGASNAGTLTLFVSTGGAGGTIATVSVGNNQTFWAHHYVSSSKTCFITGLTGNNNNSSNTTLFSLKAKNPTSTTVPELLISDTLQCGGNLSQTERIYGTPVKVVGPSRIIMYAAPGGTPVIISRGSFDYYEQ